jgi:hypothetical protein
MKPIPFNIFLETAKKLALTDQEMAQKITISLGLTFINQKEAEGNVCFADSNEIREEFKETFTAIDLVNYYYAVVNSSAYRESHQKLLKIDSITIPIDKVKFWRLIQLGKELRRTHLFENMIVVLTETDRIIKEIDAI